MFVGKFNFNKVCSNVFSPAYRDLPAVSAEKAKSTGPPRERHHVRSRKALQDQNAALDRKTSDFAGLGHPRGRRKKGGDDESGAAGAKRGLSAGPQLRKSSRYQMAKKCKVRIETISSAPEKFLETSSGSASLSAGAVDDVASVNISRYRNPKEHFRSVVQTKVASLNAFKRGIMGKQQVGGILKQDGSSSPRVARTVRFSSQLSEPDLSGVRTMGSSFESNRSLSDESILLASSYVCKDDPPEPPETEKSDATCETTPDLLLLSTSSESGTTAATSAEADSLQTAEAEELMRLRVEITAQIARSLMQLDLVNRRLDQLLLRKKEVEASSSDVPSSPAPPSLTEDHRRLLRFKSFSYPFLCEDAWYRAGDEYLAAAAAGAHDYGPYVNGGGLEWEGSVEGEDDDGGEDAAGAKLAWTDFLKLQETSLGPESDVL